MDPNLMMQQGALGMMPPQPTTTNTEQPTTPK